MVTGDHLLGNIRGAPHPIRVDLHPAPVSSFRPPALLDTLDSFCPIFLPVLEPNFLAAFLLAAVRNSSRCNPLPSSAVPSSPFLCQGRPPCYPTSPPLLNKGNGLECVRWIRSVPSARLGVDTQEICIGCCGFTRDAGVQVTFSGGLKTVCSIASTIRPNTSR